MRKATIICRSSLDTELLGVIIGRIVKPGTVITLAGELGSGKTTLAKGMGKSLELKRPVTSPTFTVMKEYEGRIPVYHIDTYRIRGTREALGFNEVIYGIGVAIIEWPDAIADLLPDEHLEIKINYLKGNENGREIVLNAMGRKYEAMCGEIVHDFFDY